MNLKTLNDKSTCLPQSVKWTFNTLLNAFGLLLFLNLSSIEIVEARKPGVAGESEIKAGKFEAAANKLEALEIKNADEWYLLGKAYMGLGKKKEAYEAWTEALHINEKLSQRKKWTFLFPPNKPLKGAQKKNLKKTLKTNIKNYFLRFLVYRKPKPKI